MELQGKRLVLSGTFKRKKADITSDLRLLGATVTSGGIKNADYLVTGKNPGMKFYEAKKKKITILTEAQITKLIDSASSAGPTEFTKVSDADFLAAYREHAAEKFLIADTTLAECQPILREFLADESEDEEAAERRFKAALSPISGDDERVKSVLLNYAKPPPYSYTPWVERLRHLLPKEELVEAIWKLPNDTFSPLLRFSWPLVFLAKHDSHRFCQYVEKWMKQHLVELKQECDTVMCCYVNIAKALCFVPELPPPLRSLHAEASQVPVVSMVLAYHGDREAFAHAVESVTLKRALVFGKLALEWLDRPAANKFKKLMNEARQPPWERMKPLPAARIVNNEDLDAFAASGTTALETLIGYIESNRPIYKFKAVAEHSLFGCITALAKHPDVPPQLKQYTHHPNVSIAWLARQGLCEAPPPLHRYEPFDSMATRLDFAELVWSHRELPQAAPPPKTKAKATFAPRPFEDALQVFRETHAPKKVAKSQAGPAKEAAYSSKRLGDSTNDVVNVLMFREEENVDLAILDQPKQLLSSLAFLGDAAVGLSNVNGKGRYCGEKRQWLLVDAVVQEQGGYEWEPDPPKNALFAAWRTTDGIACAIWNVDNQAQLAQVMGIGDWPTTGWKAAKKLWFGGYT